MLAAVTLDRRRASQERRFTDSVEVLSQTMVREAGGGRKASGAVTVEATYAGRVLAETLDPMENLAAGRPASTQLFKILLPWNAAVNPTHTLRVGGQVYQILGTDGGETDAVLLTITAVKIQ